jgi:16S rRNA G966 N2-methylase RsmD
MKIECAHDQLIDLAMLVPNPKNPNNHPDRQVELLAKIISYQGQRSPIVVSSRSGFIVKGHGRLEAIKRLGWAQAAVDYQDYENEAQEFADMIADNKIAELAEHDDALMIEGIKELDFKDLELLGLDGFELPEEPLEPGIDEDEVPENVDTRCKPGDIWQLGSHRLMCGDSTNIQHVEKLMDGKKTDMVFTDPPYGVSVVEKSSALKDLGYRPVENDGSIDTAVASFSVAQTISQNLIFWGGNYYAHKLPEAGSWIVWRKKENDSDQHDFEVAWLSMKMKMACFSHTWSGWWRESEKGEQRSHPTQKPIVLAEWCFENYGKSKTVLDLFGGSGSTLIACEKTKRKCFMMELDPHYCDVILSRWEKYTNKTAERLIEGEDGQEKG